MILFSAGVMQVWLNERGLMKEYMLSIQ